MIPGIIDKGALGRIGVVIKSQEAHDRERIEADRELARNDCGVDVIDEIGVLAAVEGRHHIEWVEVARGIGDSDVVLDFVAPLDLIAYVGCDNVVVRSDPYIGCLLASVDALDSGGGQSTRGLEGDIFEPRMRSMICHALACPKWVSG